METPQILVLTLIFYHFFLSVFLRKTLRPTLNCRGEISFCQALVIIVIIIGDTCRVGPVLHSAG